VERAAIWQDARLRADQGGPALRSPRAAGALIWDLPLMVSHPEERVHR